MLSGMLQDKQTSTNWGAGGWVNWGKGSVTDWLRWCLASGPTAGCWAVVGSAHGSLSPSPPDFLLISSSKATEHTDPRRRVCIYNLSKLHLTSALLSSDRVCDDNYTLKNCSAGFNAVCLGFLLGKKMEECKFNASLSNLPRFGGGWAAAQG